MGFNTNVPQSSDFIGTDGKLSGAGFRYLAEQSKIAKKFNNPNGLTDNFAISISIAANQDYTVELSAPWAGNITKTFSQCDSGSCTLTWKINGVALAGGTSAVTTSIDTDTQDNDFAAGAKITITVSSNSSCRGLFAQANFTKPYA